MSFTLDDSKPIYVQIAEWLETEIINDHIQTDEKMYSQYQLAEMFNINPATAAKGINILAEENILYKRRGLGMFVAENAKQIILKKRKDKVLKKLIYDVVLETNTLGVSKDELIEMIESVTLEEGEA